MKLPRVGCVKYLNARPLIHGWPGEVVFDHPSALCIKLVAGELDLALVSSVEFLRNPIYSIVDGVSISSDGAVYSVVVAHRGKISEAREVELDPASETSVYLLRVLFAELQLTPRFVTRSTSGSKNAHLLIGDQAIRFRQQHGDEFKYWDLGEQWKKIAGVPFVYALWLVRPEVASARSIADQLRALRDQNLAEIDKLIASEKEFDPEFCRRYYHHHLRFTFGEKERVGLTTFQRSCQKNQLLPEREIEFNIV